MTNLNRREVCAALSAFAALSGVTPGAWAEADAVLGTSKVIPYDELKVVETANGGSMRKVMSGVLPTGEFIEIHETTLPAGKMPHPPHRHPNTEILFIQEGKLEYLNDGKPEPVEKGGIIFTASNVMHGLKNVGDGPANYIVMSVGRQLKAG
jgi:quercetin dioxygenase-like cupin family protein